MRRGERSHVLASGLRCQRVLAPYVLHSGRRACAVASRAAVCNAPSPGGQCLAVPRAVECARQQPSLSCCGEPDAADQQGRREASEQWESARLATDLAGLQFFFVGDARHESLLPKEVGSDLVERFETLAIELDSLFQREDENQIDFDPVYECSRDTIALATALIRHRPIVFSLTRDDRDGERPTEPKIGDFLRRCGINCRPVEQDRALVSIRNYLQPIFARSGVAELLWDLAEDGYALVVLHLIAPYALVMPIEAELERRYGELAEVPSGEAGAARWFRGASAYWWHYA